MISNSYEGRFLERVAPGAFVRTIREDRSRMRVLLNHGTDPYIGDKPLAPLDILVEQSERGGAYYGGRLFATSYNRDLVPALQAGQFGSSFRFAVMCEEWVERPGKSTHNPEGLRERTIREAHVFEMGPVTFPAYAGATAGVRLSSPPPAVPQPRMTDDEWLRWCQTRLA